MYSITTIPARGATVECKRSVTTVPTNQRFCFTERHKRWGQILRNVYLLSMKNSSKSSTSDAELFSEEQWRLEEGVQNKELVSQC
jgi:hypothetical protein